MLQRRVSRRARGPPARPTSPPVNLEPTPATSRPSSFPRRRESITARAAVVAPMRRVSGARAALRPDPTSPPVKCRLHPAEAGIHPGLVTPGPALRRVPVARAVRSPRVAPMLHRRVSRGARRGFRPDRPTSARLAPSWLPSAAARRRGSPSPLPSPVEGEGVRAPHRPPPLDSRLRGNDDLAAGGVEPTPATSRPSSFPRRRESITVVVRHALVECTSSPGPGRRRSPFAPSSADGSAARIEGGA